MATRLARLTLSLEQSYYVRLTEQSLMLIFLAVLGSVNVGDMFEPTRYTSLLIPHEFLNPAKKLTASAIAELESLKLDQT